MNEITETSPKAATPSGPETAAREALTGARLRAIATVLDHYENYRSEIRARLSHPIVVKDPQAVAAMLDHHEARRAARSASPAPVAVLLDLRAGAR